MLPVLILVFGPISGAQMNPAITAVLAMRREIRPADAGATIAAQAAGAVAGVALAHVMFAVPLLQASATARRGAPQWIAEAVATAGLVITVLGVRRARPETLPLAVGLYIAAAYWFTSSTSFANPAVTLARSFTDSFSGIAPADAPAFILVQFAAALLAARCWHWLAEAPAAASTGGTA